MKNLNKLDLIYLVISFLITVAIVWFGRLAHIKYTKGQIAKKYNVSKPTLNHWVKVFYQEQYPEWFKLRKVSFAMYLKIRGRFGDNIQMVMNKSQMCDKFSTNNKYLRKIIKQRGHEIGLDENIWNSCSVFPPSIVIKLEKLIDSK